MRYLACRSRDLWGCGTRPLLQNDCSVSCVLGGSFSEAEPSTRGDRGSVDPQRCGSRKRSGMAGGCLLLATRNSTAVSGLILLWHVLSCLVGIRDRTDGPRPGRRATHQRGASKRYVSNLFLTRLRK